MVAVIDYSPRRLFKSCAGLRSTGSQLAKVDVLNSIVTYDEEQWNLRPDDDQLARSRDYRG